MLDCPACKRPVNVYATCCQHCGGALTPTGTPPLPEPEVRGCCVKCGHAKFVVVSPFRLPDTERDGSVVQMAVAAFTQEYSVTSAGSFRAQVCLACGHTEWYATGLADLVRLAGRVPGIVAVEAKVEQPYR